MKTEKELEEGLAKLEEIMNKDKEEIHLDFMVKTRVNFEKGEGDTFHLGGKINFDILDVAKDLERIIRATEICTLKWVLGKGGGLNTEKFEFRKE